MLHFTEGFRFIYSNEPPNKSITALLSGLIFSFITMEYHPDAFKRHQHIYRKNNFSGCCWYQGAAYLTEQTQQYWSGKVCFKCSTCRKLSDRSHCMLGNSIPEPKESQHLGLKCSFYKLNSNTKLTWLQVVTKDSYYAVESRPEATEKSNLKCTFTIKPEEEIT